jgi:integrase
MRIEDAADEYLRWRQGQGFAKNTVRNDKSGINLMVGVIGNIEMSDLDYEKCMRVFDRLSETRAASSINALHSGYKAFFRWCRMRRYMGPDQDPLEGVRWRKVARKERTYIPLHEFPELLDCAPEPRDRALLALGLFLFLRASEAVSLKVGDVDLDAGTIAITVHKTGDFDIMPISAELDVELRAWLTHYTSECGPLRRDWILVPAKVQSGFGEHRLNPTARISRPQEVVKRTFDQFGLTNLQWEAMHCLRRSGARALFDELSGSGIDGALEICSAMLHHQSVTMTERYLGITHSRAKRDLLVRERGLFPSLASVTVTPIRRVV